MNVIISEPSGKYSTLLKTHLTARGCNVEMCGNGKSAQLMINKKKYELLVIDLETKNNSAIEVIRYFRIQYTSVRIFLTMNGREALEEIGCTEAAFYELGVSKILYKPYGEKELDKLLDDDFSLLVTTSKFAGEASFNVNAEVTLRDDLFTRIPADDFFSGNRAPFDLYIRINPNRYIMLFKRGDQISLGRLKWYRDEKKLDFLYFKTKDRSKYVQYMNLLAEKLLRVPGKNLVQKVTVVKNLTEKFIEDIYKEGIQPQLVDEGIKICENIHSMITKEKKLFKLASKMHDKYPTIYSHSFLVVFFSTMTCKALDWSSPYTMQKVSLGAMLHDIGKVNIDPYIMSLKIGELSKVQFEEYKKHPEAGVELVGNFKLVTGEVKQIIHQHHELADGSGFPQGISGNRIFLPAQVVGIVDKIARVMAERKVNAIDGLKIFFSDHENVNRYNRDVVKAFISCFTDTRVGF